MYIYIYAGRFFTPIPVLMPYGGIGSVTVNIVGNIEKIYLVAV